MYLLDTNVVSELRRLERAEPRVRAWAEGLAAGEFHLSVITILEIERGILLVARRDKEQARQLRAWLEGDVLAGFAERIVPVSLEIARRSAVLHVPDPMPERDALIAATALVHRMTVVTRNTADFERTGVAMLNPWQAAG
jgi:hypothetical protein